MTERDLQAQEKVEHQAPGESTRDLPVYVPLVDIYESEDALTLVADMPGVGPENVAIDVREDVLIIQGSVTADEKNERMLMQEYGVGDYYREFRLGKTIDQTRIEASMRNGVLILTLPKAEMTKPRRINVKMG